jgi:hypothetical protein
VTAATALLLACATVPVAPKEEDARARDMAVPEGRALVYVFRGPLLAAPTAFTLYANSERIGDLGPGTYYLLDVEPGVLRLGFPFGDGATVIALEVEAGKRYYVFQTIHRVPALFVNFDKAKLIPVEEDEGKGALGSLIRVVRLDSHEERDRAARAIAATPGRGLVVVYRRLWWGATADFEILLNGAPVGIESARSFVVAEVPAGPVVLTVKGAATQPLSFEVGPGGEVFIEAIPRVGFSPTVELRTVEAAKARGALSDLRVAGRATF